MQQYADIYSLHSHSCTPVLLMLGAMTPETCKMSDCAVNKCLHTVASSWTFLLTLNHDARNHEFKMDRSNFNSSQITFFVQSFSRSWHEIQGAQYAVCDVFCHV